MATPTETTDPTIGDTELAEYERELNELLKEKQQEAAQEQAIADEEARIKKLEQQLAGEEKVEEAIDLTAIEEKIEQLGGRREKIGAASVTSEEQRRLRETLPVAQETNQRIEALTNHELQVLVQSERQGAIQREYGPGRLGEFRAFLNGEHEFDVVMDKELGPQVKYNWKQETARRLTALGLKTAAAAGVAGTLAILTGGGALIPIAYGFGANVGVRAAFEAGRALFGKKERELREKLLNGRIENVKQQKEMADELAKIPRHEQEQAYNQKLSELANKMYEGESTEMNGWRKELITREKKIGRAEEWTAFLASFTASTYGVLTGKQALIEQLAQAEKEKMQKVLEQGGKVLLDIDKASPQEIARMGLQETHHWVQKIGEQYYFFYSKAEVLAHNATKHILDAASVAKIPETIAEAARAAAGQAAKGEITARLIAMFTGWAALSVGKWQVEALGTRRNSQRLTDVELHNKARAEMLGQVIPKPLAPPTEPPAEAATRGAEDIANELDKLKLRLEHEGKPLPEAGDEYNIEWQIGDQKRTVKVKIESIEGLQAQVKGYDPELKARISGSIDLRKLSIEGTITEQSLKKRRRRETLEYWKKYDGLDPQALQNKFLKALSPLQDTRGPVIEKDILLRFSKIDEESGIATLVKEDGGPVYIDLATLTRQNSEIITRDRDRGLPPEEGRTEGGASGT